MAQKPGGVETLRALRLWSPSARVSSIVNGEWAPAVLLTEDAVNPGLNGRLEPGQGVPSGPDSRLKYWAEVWSESWASQGVKVLLTG